MKILCVEHHPAHLGTLQRMLEKSGHKVTPASNADQAYSLFAAQSFDGVLLEQNLPDRTGSAVREEMKRIKPDIPVLLFAGVGPQTPMLLEFFDAYVGHERPPGSAVRDDRVA
jgi:DNA-binding response OmpR family regulator